jgi:paraquat-inducible protein B
MSKPVNPTLIGAFVMGGLVLGVTAIMVFGGNAFTQRERVIMYFGGSVDGLAVGAPVNVRGVQIGTVTAIDIQFDTETGELQVPVIAEIQSESIDRVRDLEAEDPLRAIIEDLGLRAQLRMQSLLTSQLYVHLDYFPGSEIHYEGDGSLLEIPTIPSPLERFDKALNEVSIERILAEIMSAISAINRLVSSGDLTEAIGSMKETLENVNTISRELLPVANNMNQALIEAKRGLADMQRVMSDLQRLLGEDSPLLAKLDAALVEIDSAAGTISRLEELPQMRKLSGTLDEIAGAARSVRGLESSPQMVNLAVALEEITSAARAVRLLADMLERQPEALLKGKSVREE